MASIYDIIASNIGLVITAVVPILGILISQYFGRKRIRSANRERFSQAKNSLLDILEEQIVDNRDLSDQRVKNLISAVERDYNVTLTDQISMNEIYQDLLLRFEESKLDMEDKEEYTSKIEDQIGQLMDRRRIEDLPSEYSAAYSELKELSNVEADDIVEAFEEARAERRTEYQETSIIQYMLFPGFPENLPRQQRARYRMIVMTAIMFYILLIYFVFFF